MITVDGERSLKRLPIAKKALAVIKSLGLMAKASLYEGFSYKVWQDGDLSGGRITSPAGIFVLLSANGRLQQFVCDSFGCLAAPVFAEADGGRHVMAPAPLPSIADGVKSAVGGITPVESAQTVLMATQSARTLPVCLPFGGELVTIHCAFRYWGGSATLDANVVQLTDCLSNGDGAIGIPGISQFSGRLNRPATEPQVIVPMWSSPGYFEYLQWQPKWQMGITLNDGIDFLLATYYYMYGLVYGASVVTARGLYGDATSEYWDIATRQFTEDSYDWNHAHVVLQGAHFTRTDGNINGALALTTSAAIAGHGICGVAPPMGQTQCPCVDPATEEYAVTLSFFDLAGAPKVLKFGELKDFLYGLAAGELAYMKDAASMGFFDPADPDNTDWGRRMAGAIMGALFGPGSGAGFYGNTVRRNASTFSDAAGNVYSWLRSTDPGAAQTAGVVGSYAGARNGGFKFALPTVEQPNGEVKREAITMPPGVLGNADASPTLTLLTADTYLCVSRLSDGTLEGVYVGKPVGGNRGWAAVAAPVGTTLVAVRPIIAASDIALCGFIAIGKTVSESGVAYRAYLKMPNADWAAMSPMPASVVDDSLAAWDVCVFGNDPLAVSMLDVRQHPHAYS